MLKECNYCKQQFNAPNSKSKFCCKKCFIDSLKKPHTLYQFICLNCNKNFKSENKNRKFCSLDCSNKYNGKNGKVGGDVSSLKKFIELYGEEEGKKRYNKKSMKSSASLKGKPSPMKNKKHSENTKYKLRKILKKYIDKIRGKTFDEIHGNGASKELSKKMKGKTFTKTWFIEKYGEKEGIILYKQRCKRISNNNPLREYNKINKNNYSKLSQELFWKIYKNFNKGKIYFAELNHEHSCYTGYFNFDFVSLKDKKIIEFNGDKFHANPSLYKKNDTPDPYNKTLTSKEIWEKDAIKINKVLSKDFKIHIVWEKDYINNKKKIVKKCLEFLNA